MAIKGFIDNHSSVPGASNSHPTKASAPLNKDGTFPTGHPMHNKTPPPKDDNAKDYAWGRSEYGANADFTPVISAAGREQKCRRRFGPARSEPRRHS